ncbi:lipoprotein [Vibrio nigripulchritudo]|uniref:lipoprotein n=1 Tax=Vibrio nigripulchritudo TaxID=28173 RepID=UPI0005FA63F0|nr:lipoprotein [Vibrio nigripulchritudo]KJY76480.1 lipoprotein [Vibrio nigripulchritudo]
MRKLSVITLAVASFGAFNAYADSISTAEVEAAQIGWGEGIVKIGKASDPREAAIKHLEEFYAFGEGQVLFKPTLASVDQFRGTQKEALSYFIGQDLAEDKGFALAPYIKVRWENEGIITDGDSAMAMGNYFFTKTNGEEVKVEYSFGYIKDEEGNVKINLHHSSLPFSPK